MATSQPHLNIVLVEDHDILRKMVKQALEEAGHHVTDLSCAEELEDVAAGQPADIFLIDLNLPGEDGLSLTERVRAAYPLAGLIVVTARSGLQDKLEGYARGADLYMSKPVEVPELCAAVAALGRRRQSISSLLEQHQTQLFTVNQQLMQLSKPGGKVVSLTASETALLSAFSRAPGLRIAYWQIAETLGLNLDTYPKASLEVRIVRPRKKLIEAGASATCIESVRGHGYQLCVSIQVI